MTPENVDVVNSSAREIIVPPESAGLRLDVFVSRLFIDRSRSQIQKLIATGSITVNGQVVPKKYAVSGGDIITVTAMESVSHEANLIAQDIPLSILYEDDHFLAIDKPAGLVVHPGSGNRNGTLVNALLFHCHEGLSPGSAAERPGIVHRLDKDTSGVIIVAKTAAAHAALAAAFSSRTIKKNYIGFCIGRPPDAAGFIDVPLARSRRNPVKRAPDKSGKLSRTAYRLLDFRSGIALVEFMPLTGRTHQIRVHCASSGFPIVADTLYGGGKERLLQVAPLDRAFASSIHKCFTRHALHAVSITFTHPFLKKEITIKAPLPQDFRNALALYGNPSPLLQ
ncbi:MAG: RluA family pseudouridine synthase [Chitinispirillaceae bacterium]